MGASLDLECLLLAPIEDNIFDQLVAKATGLANSLETTGSILGGLEGAGFKVSDSTGLKVIASYEEEEAGLLADAYSLAIDKVNRVLGPDGADKLHIKLARKTTE